MNIIIPLGGKGERFKEKGFSSPKPLIQIFDKEMIFYVLDNITIKSEDKVFIIYYNLDGSIFESTIKLKYSNVYFIELNKQTSGAAETIYIGLQQIIKITNNKKTLLMDCDTFYTEDVTSMFRDLNKNAVFFNKNTEKTPIFSYITMDNTNTITKIAEKNKISDNANTGIYCFQNIEELFCYSKKVVLENIKFNNECYTSCIIDEMIKNNHEFIGIELLSKYVFNLGTPEQLNEYLKQTYCFLFDLDGTLILTDEIYYKVWTIILKEYNIKLTTEIFQNYIFGNTDTYVINAILFDKTIIPDELSKKKDEIFLTHLDSIKLIEGGYSFLKDIKKSGHKLALVTNCNRIVAEAVIQYFNLHEIFDCLIIGNECDNPKPYPDPYSKAINFFNTTSDNVIIFEDSKSGLLSATSVNPKCIVGIETTYSNKELLQYNANKTIRNFVDVDFNSFIAFNNINIESLKSMIIESLSNSKIKDLHIFTNKLKGGFIADVLQIKLIKSNETMDCVLKMENMNETFLSTMSNALDLHNREYYFYDTICKYIPINYPQPYGLIKDNNFKTIGVLLENLNTEDFILNLDLNKEDVTVSLKVLDSLSIMHSKFWGKPIDKHFTQLKKNNDTMFCPMWKNFILERWDTFKLKWSNILSNEQLHIGQYIVDNYTTIQLNLSDKNLTFCHGDVKSANIFYKKHDESYIPYFIDWQYIIHGKGVQDLVFFMIESFDTKKMKLYKLLLKEYYYLKLVENGVKNYSKEEYEIDFINASYYFPFFVAIWFGTMNEDELIDKHFPMEYIKKLFTFYTC
jgi:beta-phosphoglucomutase-like phosphatase (HAD superfamily)/LysM repeat protein